MADRYWIGGSGTWDTTSTTNWSTSSGGSSGASVPTVADNVIFDQAGTYTVTMTGALACLDITVSAGTVTFATGTTPTLNVAGSMSLAAATTWSSTGTITFSATTTGKTITTNGVTINAAITFNGSGGAWTLGSALTTSGSRDLTVTRGTFDTGNYNVTLTGGRIVPNGSLSKTISLGSSTLTMATWYDLDTSNTTLNAGTSTITLNGSGGSMALSNKTYYDVNITSGIPPGIQGSNFGNFRNLTYTAPAPPYVALISYPNNFTVTGTLSFGSPSALTARTFVASATIGTTVTITCAAFSGSNIDFRDITIAGAASPISGTSFGDCKGNSGITFTAAKTVYWNLASGGNWTATAWATTSTGTPAAANFPLAQDTCIFSGTTSSLSDGGTVTINENYNIGTLDLSARTTPSYDMVLNWSNNGGSGFFPNIGTAIYGNVIYGTGAVLKHSSSATASFLQFLGRTTQTLTTAGVTAQHGVVVNAPSTNVVLQDAFTSSTSSQNAVSVIKGTFDAAGYSVTLSGAAGGVRVDSGTDTRTIAIGSGTWTISGTSPWTLTTTGSTITGTGTLSFNSASSKTFAGGGGNYSGITITNSGAGALVFTGSNTIGTLSNSVQPTTFSFTAGTTQTLSNWNVNGTAGNLVTIQSATAASHTLSKSSGTVSADYLSISRSTATGGASWYAGANSTNGGNNVGWNFNAPPVSNANFLMLF